MTRDIDVIGLPNIRFMDPLCITALLVYWRIAVGAALSDRGDMMKVS